MEERRTEEPKVYFECLQFNDGMALSLHKNSIIVFTGANNCGKSQILRELENKINPQNGSRSIILSDCKISFSGDIDHKAFLDSAFYRNDQGNYYLSLSGYTYPCDLLKRLWNSRSLDNGLGAAFVKRLSTEKRITLSNALRRDDQSENSPIYKLYKSDTLASLISNYFHQAFGVDLVVNRNEMRTIPLHVGTAPDKKAYTMEQHDEYYQMVSDMPKLQDQGDGMRSFASVLLDTFTSDYRITLIDEPEAFLHPPQARLLGKMLAKHNPENRQLFISTHSEDFLQGLLDANNDNVTVIRIDRQGNVNRMSVLENEKIKNLWGNPILRYSNILSGLFHEKVVVCESDYDCLFYQAVINSIYENNHDISPDILFTHCGGKDRVKDVVSALKAINVTVAAITDFDILDDSRRIKPIIASFGLDWDSDLKSDMETFYQMINTEKSKGYDIWETLKKTGKNGLKGDAPAAYERVEEKNKSVGLFIVPVGEMECFDKTINKEKKDWVYHVLENYNLAIEPKLEGARQFVKEVAEYVGTHASKDEV